MSKELQNVFDAIVQCDPNALHIALDGIILSSSQFLQVHNCFLQLISDSGSMLPDCSSKNLTSSYIYQTEQLKCVIYELVESGLDLELQDENDNTCLFHAVKEKNDFICDILLQCGANMWANTQFDISIHDYVCKNSPSSLLNVFEKYYPGLWKAVEDENIYQARKLINLWCRTDLNKDGISLKELALNTGKEEIISLILGILDSMQLVYHILSKNTEAVKKLLETKRQRIRLELRKMSERGAPILYFLIQSEDVPLIQLFIEHGCHIYTVMQDESGCDMPVVFSALKPDLKPEIAEALLQPHNPRHEEMLHRILYKGCTLLEGALFKNVNLPAFEVLVDKVGPLLLSERNQLNQTVRDVAASLNKTELVDCIDSIVLKWILNPWKFPQRRQKIALYGWNLEDIEEGIRENMYVDKYFNHYKPLQLLVQQLSDAIDDGDTIRFLNLKDTLCDYNESENFLWHGRPVGDGMPLLHRAVLHNRLTMAEVILANKPAKESIDNLFDQYQRTALHYAYAASETKEIRKLLTSYGCSEHVLDKLNREPLDFRDKQDSPEMIKFLKRLKFKDFVSPDVDPWQTEQSVFLDSGVCDESSEGETHSDYSEDEEETPRRSCIMS